MSVSIFYLIIEHLQHLRKKTLGFLLNEIPTLNYDIKAELTY